MNNFDVANIALKAVCPSNEMIVDDKGMPSVMVKIPKCTWADLGIGTSTETFPAFIINGKEVDAIYFSKYQNISQNSRAYSLPGQDPGNSISLDTSITRCANKGEGWHLQTRLEWMAVALWCLKNGFLPNGNNYYGRDYAETLYKAIPTFYDSGKVARVATGTGPLTWSHNNAPDGIWDMNGNVSEWVGGIRMVYGELQVISRDGRTFGNDAADPDNSQSATSSLWYAIDGTTGELITPNGTGTTPNSLKLDMVSSKWKWITGAITDAQDTYRNSALTTVTCDETVCEAAMNILRALGFLKLEGVEDSAYKSDQFFCNNGNAERSFHCGGHWSHSSYAGVFFVYGYYGRSVTSPHIGFRAAFVELPTA